jgi:hypothetical protein
MTTFSIAAIGGRGPKSTAVNFLKSEQGVRLWAWIPNDIASRLRPGMTIAAEQVSFGRTETGYEDKSGSIVELKVPKRQVFFGGNLVIGAPESESLAPIAITFADGVDAYAQAFDAKHADGTNNDDNKSF